jgi:hypothetical protein
MLKHFIIPLSLLELLMRNKVIVLSMYLAFPGLSGGKTDNELEDRISLKKLTNDGSLANSRRSNYYQ